MGGAKLRCECVAKEHWRKTKDALQMGTMYNTPITNNQALILFLSTSDSPNDQMAVGHLRYSTETKHTRSNMNLEKQPAVKQSEWVSKAHRMKGKACPGAMFYS